MGFFGAQHFFNNTYITVPSQDLFFLEFKFKRFRRVFSFYWFRPDIFGHFHIFGLKIKKQI